MALTLIPAFPAKSQTALFGDEGTDSKTFAVVYGISDYQEINDLNFAHRDAEEFAKYLKEIAKVPADNIRLRTNQEATTGNLWTDLTWLKRSAVSGTKAIIYFSGHGSKETETSLGLGFLLTYNSPKSNYPAGAFGIQYLKAIVSDISAQGSTVVVITDACRSGMVNQNPLTGMSDATANLKEQFTNEIKILSCEPGQLSYEDARWGDGRSVFSYYLVEGLKGKADNNPKDGQITILELENYLESNVPREVNPKKQIPFALGSKETVIAIVPVSADNSQPVVTTAPPANNTSTLKSKSVLDPATEAILSSFNKAIAEGRLLMPMRDCADYYLQQLNGKEVDGEALKYELAGALQDASLQAYNQYMKSDSLDLAKLYKTDANLTLYPAYLKRAADLLGADHYLYNTLKSRELYFEGLIKRLEYLDSGKKDEKVLEEALAKQSQSQELQEEKTADSYLELGILKFDSGKYSEAIQDFQEAKKQSPQWYAPLEYLAACYFYLQKFDESEKYLREAIPLAPAELQAQLKSNLGAVLEVKGAKDEAASLYQEAIEMDGGDPWTLFDLAHYYFAQKDYRNAESYYRQALDIDPDFDLARLMLGINIRDDKRFEQAQVEFDILLAKDPNNTRYLYESGANLYYMSAYDQAAATLEKLLKLEPGHEFGADILGYVYEAMGNTDKQDELKSQQEDLTAQIPGLLVAIQESIDAGEYQDAEDDAIAVLDLDPNNVDAVLYLVQIFNDTERNYEAIGLLESYWEHIAATDYLHKLSDESIAQIQLALGESYLLVGEIDWAEEEVLFILNEIIPDYPPALDLLNRINEARN